MGLDMGVWHTYYVSNWTIYYCVLKTLVGGKYAQDKGRWRRKQASKIQTVNGGFMREGALLSCSSYIPRSHNSEWKIHGGFLSKFREDMKGCGRNPSLSLRDPAA